MAWAKVVVAVLALSLLTAPCLAADEAMDTAALRAENAKLRKTLDQQGDDLITFRNEIAQLKATIKKLNATIKKLNAVQDPPDKTNPWAGFGDLQWGVTALTVGQTIERDNLKIQLKSVSRETVVGTVSFSRWSDKHRAYRNMKEEAIKSTKPLLVMRCLLTNISKGQVFSPNASNDPLLLIDNFGNKIPVGEPVPIIGWEKPRHAVIPQAMCSLFGSRKGLSPDGPSDRPSYRSDFYRELKAGETIALTLLCGGPKVDNATAYVFPINLKTSLKTTVRFRLAFKAEDIKSR